MKELVQDDKEKVNNADDEDRDSDDDSGDGNGKPANDARNNGSSSSAAIVGTGEGVVKSESSATLDPDEDQLDVNTELPDYLAELYMSEQLAVNHVPWSVLAQQQIVHRFDGSGKYAVMTSAEVAELLNRNSKRSGVPEVVNLDEDESDILEGSSSNRGDTRTGYAFSGKCEEVIDLFSDDVTVPLDTHHYIESDVIDLDGDDDVTEEEDGVGTTDVVPPAPVMMTSLPPVPSVVRNDYSNMLTGGVGTVQKSSIYSSGASGRFIPAVIPSSNSNNSLGGLASARSSVSPGIIPTGAATGAPGHTGTTPRQFVPKKSISPRKMVESAPATNASEETVVGV